MTIDYQKLLIKYLRHLKDVEDTMFLEMIGTPFSKVIFTAEEKAFLQKMEQLTLEK